MKKTTFGPQLFIYPMPTVIVGAMVRGKPNFNTIAYCGVAQSKPPMLAVSMDKKRYTNDGIRDSGSFSVNIPSKEMLTITDYIGTRSGRNIDKSVLFQVFYGKLKTAPMIEQCPVNIECELVDIVDFGGKNDLFIGRIAETYAAEKYKTGSFPDLKKVNPFVYTRHDHYYWAVGEYLGESGEVSKGFEP
jgi:flavin reductase (DIM6/NTAB) family NADH-FMN oxidoreductase RutF